MAAPQVMPRPKATRRGTRATLSRGMRDTRREDSTPTAPGISMARTTRGKDKRKGRRLPRRRQSGWGSTSSVSVDERHVSYSVLSSDAVHCMEWNGMGAMSTTVWMRGDVMRWYERWIYAAGFQELRGKGQSDTLSRTTLMVLPTP